MITKDRYSMAFLFLVASTGASIMLLRNDKGVYASLFLTMGIIPLIYLFNKSSRLHLSNEQKTRLNLEFKDENNCGFTKTETKDIDGIKIDGRRYKLVNGTDICVNPTSDHIVPCGFGSKIMQFIAGGGLEPKSIQNDACWK